MYSVSSFTFLDRVFLSLLSLTLASIHVSRRTATTATATKPGLLLKLDVKGCATLLSLFSVFLLLVCDVWGMALKYLNGYVLMDNVWVEKPLLDYRGGDLVAVVPLDMIFNYALVLMASAYFLMLVSWNQSLKALFKDMLGVYDKESKIYIGLAALGPLLYPIFILVFVYSPTLTTLLTSYTSLIYLIQLFGVSVLCLWMRFRFLALFSAIPSNSAIIRTQTYVKSMTTLFFSLSAQFLLLTLLVVFQPKPTTIVPEAGEDESASGTSLSSSSPVFIDIPGSNYSSISLQTANLLATLFNFSFFLSFIAAIYTLYPSDLFNFKKSMPLAVATAARKEFINLDPSKCINVSV